jgi:16S rRNA (cytosine967-C5)-methyltransferase
LNSRAVAAAVLVRVADEGRSLTASLDETLPSIGVEKDRAFVQALCFGVMRWYWRLDWLLQQLATKPIRDPQIRMLALLGLYQLDYSRVKTHAAVAETVSAAGRKTWAKPLLNGILRTYLRERERLQASARQVPRATSSHPDWLARLIRQDWPEQADALFQAANLQAPLALRVNLAKISRDDYLARLTEAGLQAAPSPVTNSALILDQAVPAVRLPGLAQGLVSVQDTAAQLAAGLLDLAPGQRVLDLCAAPGGKTLHILETCPEVALTALDCAPERVKRIHENLSRGGLRARVVTADACDPESWWEGQPFERILLDAPCSATGVIRRHPDIKLLRQADDLDALQALQARILESAWQLLAPGGMLVYATCSVLKQENEEQIGRFLTAHPEAREIDIEASWGQARPHGRQILTGQQDMDGFYYARIGK